METLITLSNIDRLYIYNKNNIDGLLFGGPLSLNFNYSLKEIKKISDYCFKKGLKRYLVIDAFIEENDLSILYDYFDFIRKLDLDGIYFNDLAIISVASAYDLNDKLIYDPETLLTNSLDINFFLRQDIGTVLSRELNYQEVKKILLNNPYKCDMQIFGHLKLSYSKRHFMTNYFNYLDKKEIIDNKYDLTIKEENRQYNLPIVENEYGTCIYSDYILLCYKELSAIKTLLKRGIINELFIEDDNLINELLRNLKHLSDDNALFLEDNIISKYDRYHFSKGFLNLENDKEKEDAFE